jgi:hypothetical protein
LLISLDHTFGPYLCTLRVLSGRSACPALPEQIPTLVERHLDRSQARQLLFGKTLAGVGSFKEVFLVGELIDAAHDLLVIHW